MNDSVYIPLYQAKCVYNTISNFKVTYASFQIDSHFVRKLAQPWFTLGSTSIVQNNTWDKVHIWPLKVSFWENHNKNNVFITPPPQKDNFQRQKKYLSMKAWNDINSKNQSNVCEVY